MKKMPKNKCDSILLSPIISSNRTRKKYHIFYKIVIGAIKIMYKINSKVVFRPAKTHKIYKEGIVNPAQLENRFSD